MTLLFIASDAREFTGLRRHTESLVPLQWPVDCSYLALLRGRRVLLVANGPGETLAGQAVDVARRRESFDAVISTGFCGALDPALVPGEIFVARDVVSESGKGPIAADIPATNQVHVTGTVITTTRVVHTASEKSVLHSRGAGAVDMESFVVAERARGWRLRFHCVRAVTDTARESLVNDFDAARGPDGRFRAWRLVAGVFANPKIRLPELMHLQRRSRMAAERLGEFLADCDF